MVNESTKKTLMHIKQHPGIRYRQLLRLSGLANGALSFHLKKLKKSKLVKAKKLQCNTTRYYTIVVILPSLMFWITFLDSTRRKIIFFLLEHSISRFKEILHHIDRAPPTTSVQFLNMAGLSMFSLDKNNQFYRLTNKSRIIRIVSYKIMV